MEGVSSVIDTLIFGGEGTIQNGNNTFGYAEFEGGGTIIGSNTFDRLELLGGYDYIFESGQTQSINDEFIACGSCVSQMNLQSSAVGSHATIMQLGGTAEVKRATLTDLNATGGATFNVRGGTDNGNNTGWTFGPIGQDEMYWVGGTGDWNDVSHWSCKSGGPENYCLPSQLDNVFFDDNSFTGTDQVVHVNEDSVEVFDMTWSDGSQSPDFISNSSNYALFMNGSLVVETGVDFGFDGKVVFGGSGAGNIIDMNGALFNNTVCVNGSGGEWILLSNTGCFADTSLWMLEGTLDLGNWFYGSHGSSIIEGGTLRLGSNSILEIGTYDSLEVRSGAILELAGSIGGKAKIRGQNNQDYDLMIRDGGTISASYADFRHMGGNGIHIMDGATVDPAHAFDHCIFSHGSNRGASTLLTIDNDQTLLIDLAVFPHNTWGSNHNVAKNLDQGHLTFTNASGNYAGLVFEEDPHSIIEWPGLRAGKWTGYADDLWHNAANWEYYYYPDTAEQVLIPAGSPNYPQIIDYDETCNGLKVENGATLTITDHTLEIVGDGASDNFIGPGDLPVGLKPGEVK